MRPRKHTDEELIAAVREVVAEHGMGVGTAFVAERVGVSQATLFKRFGSRRGLFMAAMQPPSVGAHLAAIEAGPDARPVPEQLEDLALGFLAVFREVVPAMHAFLLHMPHQPDDELPPDAPPLRSQRALKAWFQTLRDEGRVAPDVDPEAMANLLIGAMLSRVHRELVLRDGGLRLSAEDYGRAVVHMLWNGLAPRPGPVEVPC